jgi:hypothetical protein
MKNIKIMVLCLLFFSFCAGCSQCILIRSEYYDITGKVLTPKAADQDIPILKEKPDRPYEEIGVVRVLAKYGTSQEAVNEEMKKRARNAGADALFDVQVGEDKSNDVVLCGKVLSSKRNISAAGRAIVFTDKK